MASGTPARAQFLPSGVRACLAGLVDNLRVYPLGCLQRIERTHGRRAWFFLSLPGNRFDRQPIQPLGVDNLRVYPLPLIQPIPEQSMN